MTPAQHKAQAETLLTGLETARTQMTEEQVFTMQAHAHLSRALGTGTHYVSADALLVEVALPGRVYRMTHLHTAIAHALLADRA